MDRDTDHLHGSEAFVPKHSKVQPYAARGYRSILQEGIRVCVCSLWRPPRHPGPGWVDWSIFRFFQGVDRRWVSVVLLFQLLPHKLTNNLRIDPWKTIFLNNPVVWGFHVNLQGYTPISSRCFKSPRSPSPRQSPQFWTFVAAVESRASWRCGTTRRALAS